MPMRAIRCPRCSIVFTDGASAEPHVANRQEDWRWSVTAVLAFALALGASTGLVQALVHAARRFALNDFTWMPHGVFWMAPIANAFWIGMVGAVLAVLHRLVPAVASGRRILFALVALAVLNLAEFANDIHPLSLIVLAAGAGAWLSGWAASRQQLLRATLRPWLASVATIVALLAMGSWGSTALRERQALAAHAPASAASPDVLLLILDTVRARNLSLYGYDLPTTPVLDSLAGSSAVFDAAFAPSSWTLPSHSSMFTGLRPFETRTDWLVPLDATAPVLAERFASAGYATAGFVANLVYTQEESGLARGFQHYVDHRLSIPQILMTSLLMQVPIIQESMSARSWPALRDALTRFQWRRPRFPYFQRKPARLVVDEFLRWESTRDRPYFAFLNFFDAHEPYGAPGPWRRPGAAAPTPMERYDGGIARIDARIGVLLDSLRARGTLDRTIIIVTSDHGEQFGEHGLSGHGNGLYRQVLSIPLLIRAPDRLGAGVREQTAVTLQDLGATVLDLAHLPAGAFPGESLVPMLRGDAVGGSPVIAEYGGVHRGDPSARTGTFPAMQGLVHGDWHLILRDDGTELLFNLRRDPEEAVDLATDSGYALVRDSLRALLDEVR